MNRIEEFRLQAGLSVFELSSLVGISEETLCKYEKGNGSAKITSTWMKLAGYFDVPVKKLMEGCQEDTIKQNEDSEQRIKKAMIKAVLLSFSYVFQLHSRDKLKNLNETDAKIVYSVYLYLCLVPEKLQRRMFDYFEHSVLRYRHIGSDMFEVFETLHAALDKVVL